MEDMQFYDSASWSLTYDICMHVPAMFLLMTSRRPGRPYPPDYKKIRYLPITKLVRAAGQGPATQMAGRADNFCVSVGRYR